jgi:hypothetical protein
LAVAGVLQVILLKRTWKTIERQTDAAARSTAAFINKERSRLFITKEISEDFKATFYVVNRGLSPARITYEFVNCEIYDKTEHFPEVPNYAKDGEPEVFVTDTWVLPGKSDKIGSYDAGYISEDNPELLREVMSRESKVWFYGVVRWVDSVSENEHEVRFCYEAHIRDDGSKYLFPGAPEAYRGEK